MAIVDKGIKISIPSSLVPSDFDPPVVAEFSDQEYERIYTVSVLKATVEDADIAVTFDNIIEEAAIGILKQILDLITADFVAANNVEYYSEWVIVSSNSSRSLDSDFYTSTAFSYVCEVKVFIKTS